MARRDRRRGARIEWHFRWWRASPYLSNRRPGTGCANRVLRPGPERILLGCGGEGRAPLAHDLPGRQLGRQAGRGGDLAPDRPRQRVARRVDQAVAGADGGRDPAGEGEHPLGRAVEQPEDRRLVRRRLDAEMRVDDGAEFGRRLRGPGPAPTRRRAGRPGSPRRRRQARCCRRRNRALRPACRTRAGDGADGPSRTGLLRSRRNASAGSISALPRPSRAISGRQAWPPVASVSRITAPASAAEPADGSMLSAASSSGRISRS